MAVVAVKLGEVLKKVLDFSANYVIINMLFRGKAAPYGEAQETLLILLIFKYL